MLGRRRMSGRELARQLDVSASWVSYRLTGQQPIDLNDLDRIASTLGVTVADLLPRRDRETTVSYPNAPVGVIQGQRNPLATISPDGRTGRTNPPPSIRQGAQRTSARASRQLQPCG